MPLQASPTLRCLECTGTLVKQGKFRQRRLEGGGYSEGSRTARRGRPWGLSTDPEPRDSPGQGEGRQHGNRWSDPRNILKVEPESP